MGTDCPELGDGNPSEPVLLTLDNPIDKGISFESLKPEADVTRYLGSKSTKDLSDMKLTLVDKNDAATGVINVEQSYIKLMDTKLESSCHPNQSMSIQNKYLVRIGCWK